MTSITFNPVESGGDFECPPKDTYILELIEIGEFEDKPAYGSETVINTQTRMSFRVVEYDPYEDEQDWNGTEVRDYYVFWKYDKTKDKKFDTWCHEKSKTYPMLTALLGHEPEAGEDIDLSSLLGKRVKATVEPKESGYPKISNPIKYRQRRAKREEEAELEEDSPFNSRSNAA
jgi:hypothetical protein